MIVIGITYIVVMAIKGGLEKKKEKTLMKEVEPVKIEKFTLAVTFAANAMDIGLAIWIAVAAAFFADMSIMPLITAKCGHQRLARAQYVHRKPRIAPKRTNKAHRQGHTRIEARRRFTPDEVERLFYNQYA